MTEEAKDRIGLLISWLIDLIRNVLKIIKYICELPFNIVIVLLSIVYLFSKIDIINYLLRYIAGIRMKMLFKFYYLESKLLDFSIWTFEKIYK